ncbi:MAG: O-antigen polymerase [Solirubrobacterales bacterium]
MTLLLGLGLAGGLVVVGIAAAASWVDWRWILIALSAVTMLLPCGLLIIRGRLDGFEPLTWFAVAFLILWVGRPAYDLSQQHFIYAERLISPTFTRMLVAGLLAGAGFAIGYLLPVAGSLASRIPRPRELEPRRLFIWAAIVVGVALVAFALFFIHAHGWRHPASFFFRGRARLFQLSASPEATSKYFLASILLVVPAALFFLAVRRGVGKETRIGRTAGGAALACVVAFCAYNLGAGQRRYLIEMLLALALYYYLQRDRRPSLWRVAVVLVVALTVLSAIRDLRLAHARHGSASPVQWLPWNAANHLFETQDTGVAPSLALEMLVVPSELHYTYGGTTIVGPIRTLIPRQIWTNKPLPADQQVLKTVFAGKPCTLGEQCDTFSPFGEPYRDGGLPAVFIFAVLFGLFWRVAWLYFSRHRNTVVAIVGYATLLPFMITWMRGNFTLPALQATMAIGAVILAAILCRPRDRGAGAAPADREPGREAAGAPG